ncbi:MAG: universal stress protein E [Flavobacteriales bacterium]|jgi:universal stress protein E
MSTPERIFVVVDPSDTSHAALERVLKTAVQHTTPPNLKIFVAVDGDSVDTRCVNDNLCRDQSWFGKEIKQKVEALNLEYSIEVSWSAEWQKSILQASKRFAADRIYLPVHERSASSRFTFSESKWDLLKTTDCPTVLIQPGATGDRKVILVAVNVQALEDQQRELNASIIKWGKEVAAIYDADLHVVNAYQDSLNYPDRGILARETGLESDKVHVSQGYTDEAVSKIANELNADLVIMGTLGQNGLTRSRRGNTAERVIAALAQDVMVVNH